jgi:hypothetical protein
LAAILAIGLSRRPLEAHGARLVLVPALACAVTLAAAAVGWLLLHVPAAGATVFSAGVALSLYLRNFGRIGRLSGALLALPLVGMVIVPAPGIAPGGPLVSLGLLVAASAFALVAASVVRLLAQRAGFALPVRPPRVERSERSARTGLPPATRMALQMLVALGAAFVAGFLFFPGHWNWSVLTAFIVCGGAIGRGDAVYKGVLRLAGALAVLYIGLWLRDVNYAFWAAAMTLILAMLSGSVSTSGLALLGVRLEAILAGAVCAVAAAWFVTPIRTEAVIRRRLADALLALDELVQHAHLTDEEAAERHAHFEHRMNELERVAPPVRWHRRIFVRSGGEHPAEWLELADGIRGQARTVRNRLSPHESERSKLRRAIGLSRRAIADHGKAAAADEGAMTIGAALKRLRHLLAKAGHVE